MAEIIVLNDQEVAGLVSFDKNLLLIEQAFGDYSLGKSRAFPVIREKVEKHGGIFGIKSGYIEAQDALGFKAGGFWAGNKDKGLPNHQSVIMLFHPSTGQPQALIAANFVTKIRTAAIGAIGCKYLARPDSRILTVIGAGQQGINQLEATLKILPDIEEIYICDVNTEAAAALVRDMAHYSQKVRVAESLAQACSNADVIITATSSYQAIVMDAWIKRGTHINFARATVVVDDLEQCCYMGECQHAHDAGIISRESIHAQIGEVITGKKKGRSTEAEITIFDTTGVAIQDLATATYALDEALKKGAGTKITI